MDDPYTPCSPRGECPGDHVCATLYNGKQPIADVCRPPCADAGECVDGSSGNATLTCPAPDYPYCVLTCVPETCPDGMACYSTQFGDLCFWDF